MSDVRRVDIVEESEGELDGKEVTGPLCADNEDGTHVLVSWEEWKNIHAEAERLGWQSKGLIDLIMGSGGEDNYSSYLLNLKRGVLDETR